MTRDAEHTPSPQSVVVPTEPTEVMLKAWDDYRHHASGIVAWSAMLAAAPAPSSLAGGEALGRITQALVQADEEFGGMSAYRRRVLSEAILSALSPEAPARKPDNGADPEWVVNDIAELGVKIGNRFFWLYKGGSLVYGTDTEDVKDGIVQHDEGGDMHWRPVFKREFGECAHPLNRADPTRIGTVSLDDSDEWEPLPAAVALTPRHEAPAEGAGEALKPYLSLINSTPDLLSLLYDSDMLPEQTVTMRGAVSVAAVCEAYQAGLRARSSAPEAREGEAVRRQRCTRCDRGEVFGMSDDSGFWVEFSSVAGGGNEHGMNGWLELVEHWPDGRDVRREYVAKDSPLYAAPSADKLRETRQDVINQMADNIEKLALTPAKRELVKAAFRACIGRLSTPDALKGDAKP